MEKTTGDRDHIAQTIRHVGLSEAIAPHATTLPSLVSASEW
jgi:hypothetical protein